MNIIGVQRSPRFSPNSVDKDLAILEAVVRNFDGKIIQEDNISQFSALLNTADIVFSMARSHEALECLERVGQNVRVINPVNGVRNCQRSLLDKLMHENGIPVPPADGEGAGFWLKRGDAAAQSHADVVFCKDSDELKKAEAGFACRGITDFVVQAHVKGDLVKFYGVNGTDFFRVYYPSDDGQSKFGDEKVNGNAHHYDYDLDALQTTVERVASIADVPVYGGDAIIRADGTFVIIDFNDWPSFSRCREDAAKAIAALVR